MPTSMLVTDIDTEASGKVDACLRLRVESEVLVPLLDAAREIGARELVRVAFADGNWDALAAIAYTVHDADFISERGDEACLIPYGAGAAHNSTEADKARSYERHCDMTLRYRQSVIRIEEAMRRIREHWEADDVAAADSGDQ